MHHKAIKNKQLSLKTIEAILLNFLNYTLIFARNPMNVVNDHFNVIREDFCISLHKNGFLLQVKIFDNNLFYNI